VVQFVVVGLAVDQGDQRLVGLRVTEVPLPIAFGVLFSQQYVLVPQVAGGARFGFAPGPSAQGVVAVGDVQAGAFEFDQLALAIPLVFGGAAQAVFAGFQAVFSIPAVTAGGALLALPFAFDQATVAVVQLALGVGTGGTGGFPVLAVEAALGQGVAVNAQGVPAALMIVAVTDDCAIRELDLFDPATGTVSVTDAMAVLVVFGNLA